MADRKYGILEEIGSEIGYTATCALVDWLGGMRLYVPDPINDDHAISLVVGIPAARRLAKMAQAWPGRLLWIPLGYQRETDRRDRMIATFFALNYSSKQIASIAMLSERHVINIKERIDALGVMPLILKKAGIEGKAGSESPGPKAPPQIPPAKGRP